MAVDPYNRALDLLAARPYTAKELKRKLLLKEFPADQVDTVVQRLMDNGLVDDSKYALQYARSKLLGAGASRRRIKQDLARKGVADPVADQAIEQVVVDEQVNSEAIIEKIARKKLALLGDLEPLVVRRRLYAFLARRGYDVDEIGSAVSRLLDHKTV